MNTAQADQPDSADHTTDGLNQPDTGSQSNRAYQSATRRQQVEQTRARILDGLARTMARGITEVSVPAVAREAGVSVPTVYRHFPTKRALVEALPGHYIARLGSPPLEPPRDLAEMGRLLGGLYGRVEGLDETLKAASDSPVARDIRKAFLPQRLAAIEQMLAPLTVGLGEDERTRLRNVVLVLSSSAMVRAFGEYLNLSGAQAAEHVSWAIATLARGATAKVPQAEKSDGEERQP